MSLNFIINAEQKRTDYAYKTSCIYNTSRLVIRISLLISAINKEFCNFFSGKLPLKRHLNPLSCTLPIPSCVYIRVCKQGRKRFSLYKVQILLITTLECSTSYASHVSFDSNHSLEVELIAAYHQG